MPGFMNYQGQIIHNKVDQRKAENVLIAYSKQDIIIYSHVKLFNYKPATENQNNGKPIRFKKGERFFF